MDRVRGKVTVITGGGSGIGRAAAAELAAEGSAVVIGDLRERDATQAAAEISGAGGRAIGLAVDVTEEESLRALIGTAFTRLGSRF